MTVSIENITSGPYVGNGLLDTYDFSFRIDEKTEIDVWETDTDGNQALGS